MLNQPDVCRNSKIIETTYFSQEQFSLKIRTNLVPSSALQTRIYFNHGHFDYSYQLFSDSPLCRWDNAQHFPELTSFPHHYHNVDGKVLESPLKGRPVEDLRRVLAELENLLPPKKGTRQPPV
ncbi:MAG: DUF6516 family protein [bacterium]